MSGLAVTVMDYGIGNLLNVVRALQHCGASVRVVECATAVPALPERLVLPGVGAFMGGMAEMRQRGFDDLVRRFGATGRPFLGICAGVQMLFDVGEEFGEHPGLGLIPGRVKPVAEATPAGGSHRIPHIGWSALGRSAARPTWAHSPLAQMPEGESVYFVHSFAPVPANEAHRLADTFYDGVRICAAVGRDNIWGCQFHPERSGEHGLGVLRSFLAL
ncbi:imidazole glycerol phosphate synthase subunit HisH [Verminephrobacter aporrectodeae]|uniref:Imidazole glycerol phosphate synthase subunit HisH n=1 Tax=Verminephrobacter aporrectodeae subsp. tuberculatae TaxID=1110392 RepID=A0ABT3KP07_9BURK|nr:imidazole glycerol phosphate synthase subunit HisH [Verminephrobacter aporrectodeae]MCW5221409.1 imidazole glycerol phosphate synthase subunit HisH [Verminephrobacter aporrectodeae subsp. tuberculatae]MCW5257719.1 imidazole glycerol phosphate synthase subunit HisH [Verminephrobacter aporrectodeae subsp. tuberculatae]MCW5290700.1 imidazole glycerol phosphate synthase subunit HisH [Verminephrobacter aporrectodeae subsp. tuberculatae]MCW5320005.1 imidazole glycerol phosphate synthase subunit Hi